MSSSSGNITSTVGKVSATVIAVAALVAGAFAIPVVTGGSGGQSCPAFPSFPDASCTGVPSGTTLTTHSGNLDVTTNNQTVDAMNVTGCIVVDATGVTITNSQMQCLDISGSTAGQDAANPPVTVQDSTINCGRTEGSGVGTGLLGANIDALRVDISDCENGGASDHDLTLTDSFIHDLTQCPDSSTCDLDPPGTPHTDGLESFFGDDWVIQHNTIQGWTDPCRDPTVTTFDMTDGSCNGTSAININHGGTNGTTTNTLITENLMDGGSYTLLCPPNTTVNFVVTNNHFSIAKSTSVGAFGAMSTCSGANTWSGNVIEENGHSVAADQDPPY